MSGTVLRAWDLLDGLVVAATAYLVLLTFRAARALQFLLAAAVLVMLSWASRRLDLRLTGWIMDHFWSFWVVALIVVFQPELRRALFQIGRGAVLGRLTGAGRQARGHVLDEVVRAADSLAAKRIGALVVLERNTGLDHYAELGVPLDALVSADLLVSLFLPYSPLHDGAVVVRDKRLVAAGCFLPLSRTTQLGRTMGTRHRAALGLAEETDAVVVVVSEETGRISLAVDGRMDSPGDRETLRRRLGELFELSEASGARSGGWVPALLGRSRR